MAAGGFGSLLFVYLRHPGTVVRAAFHVLIGVGLAMTFTTFIAELFGLKPIPVAVIIGLLGKAVAESALRSAEKLELSAVFKLDRKD